MSPPAALVLGSEEPRCRSAALGGSRTLHLTRGILSTRRTGSRERSFQPNPSGAAVACKSLSSCLQNGTTATAFQRVTQTPFFCNPAARKTCQGVLHGAEAAGCCFKQNCSPPKGFPQSPRQQQPSCASTFWGAPRSGGNARSLMT